jgi:coniferyl-aldehyde dehydrogenase
VLAKLFDKYLDKSILSLNSGYYKCIQGKVHVAKKLTSLPFDLICFTGSTETGKLVAIEAAKNLTPCLL